MNESKWLNSINLLLREKDNVSTSITVDNLALYCDSMRASSSHSYLDELVDDNPLVVFPFEIRESITNDYYENGMASIAQKYIETIFVEQKRIRELQDLFNHLYFYSTKNDKRVLSFNTILILSQIDYCYLGDWASILAVSATRNKYLEVIEQGVRCFENWENKDACSFLKECSFKETWLQDYADEVYINVMEADDNHNVLFKENYTWKMAFSGDNSISKFEQYRSRYGSIRIKDRKQQTIGMEN